MITMASTPLSQNSPGAEDSPAAGFTSSTAQMTSSGCNNGAAGPATNYSYTEGGYDYELLGVQDSRYECPICLLCLRDPVLTTCGHKFCSGCIRHWVVNLGGKCPVDAVSLSPENIFPDNFTRREILQSMAKCPYASDGCGVTLPINELERHIHTEHRTTVMNGGPHYAGGVDAVECPYKEFGCDRRVLPSEINRHMDADIQHHLYLMSMAYQRLKKYNSRPSLDHPSPVPPDFYWRQDSRESQPWLFSNDTLDPADSNGGFIRQRSLDSLRFAQNKQNARVNPRFMHSRVAESDESLCKPHARCDAQTGGGESSKALVASSSTSTLSCAGHVSSSERGSNGPQLNDLFERLVRLEQNDREKQIKMDKLQKELTQAVKLFSASTNIIQDLTARYCHGVFVWTIRDFRNLCNKMRQDPNKWEFSPGFYTDTFGYKLNLRFNLTTPSSSSSSCGADAIHPVDVPLELDDSTFISLYVHFMRGEYDDTLRWPFQGEMTLIIIHPTQPELSITETIKAKPTALYAQKPEANKSKNRTGVGFPDFCPLSRAFLEKFVNNDSLVCKIYAKAPIE